MPDRSEPARPPTRPAPTPAELVRYGPLVRRACRELVGNVHDAEEVEQLTWLRVIKHPPRHGDSIPSWLLRIVHNVSSTRAEAEFARRQRESTPRRASYAKAPPQLVAEDQRDRAVRRALRELDERKREVLTLRYLEGWPPRRIAAASGLPVETVRSRIKRGLATLREAAGLQPHRAVASEKPCCSHCVSSES